MKERGGCNISLFISSFRFGVHFSAGVLVQHAIECTWSIASRALEGYNECSLVTLSCVQSQQTAGDGVQFLACRRAIALHGEFLSIVCVALHTTIAGLAHFCRGG